MRKMKKKYFILILVAALFTFGASSCIATRVPAHRNANVPPGQMKKITGSKSAKQYAPGQQKNKKGKKDNETSVTFEVR
ncbi:MAG: hypothetical protein PHI95_02950 [Bacteroidales bacterium]|nr:hypothetical protein [Bacteroidales bacterium]